MENRLGRRTLLTTLFTFWITALGAGLNFPTVPGDISFILIFGSFAVAMMVSLPIYLVRKAAGE